MGSDIEKCHKNIMKNIMDDGTIDVKKEIGEDLKPFFFE